MHEQGGQKLLLGYIIPRHNEAEQEQRRAAHLVHWQQLYDSIYEGGSRGLTEDDFRGWNSSYTGRPIPVEEMRIWLEETVHRLRALRPSRVLEIGCGTGLLLKRLAGACERYVGLDFSSSVLTQLRKYIESHEDLNHVELCHALPRAMSFLGDDAFDLVILNSVVQYFPDLDYLLEALMEAARVTRWGGHIFVGDVRSLPLLKAYHASVELFQAPSELSLEDLRLRISHAYHHESELVIHPELFHELGRRWQMLGRVETSLKSGPYDNELSRFRYDVLLRLGPKEELVPPQRWLYWDEAGTWREAVAKILAQHPESSVGVRGIPDRRVAAAVKAVHLLQEPAHFLIDIGKLQQESANVSGENPNTVMQLASRLGVNFCWQRFSAEGIYEGIFNPKWRDREGLPEISRCPYLRYCNVPLQGPVDVDFGRALQGYLRQRLPEYLVPSSIMVLTSWPLTSNGKIDFRALPVPVSEVYEEAREFLAPRNALETQLALIWEDLLQRKRVSIRDRFFEIGGHSLLAVSLLSRIERVLGQKLPLATFFETQTIEGMADLLRQRINHRASSTLIPVQARGTKKPFFCIARPNANALGFVFLARRLGPDQPLYVLQHQYREEKDSPYTDAEYQELAREYIESLQIVQPDGPYALAGQCEGAHIAFEMARQLEAQGQVVDLLAIFDAWPIENTRSYLLSSIHYYHNHLRSIVRQPSRLMNLLHKKSKEAVRLLFFPGSKSETCVLQPNLWKGRYWPGKHFVAPTIKGKIVVLRVLKQPYWRISAPDLGWSDRTTGNLEVHWVSGEHDTLLREPHVERIAQVLGHYLPK